MTQNFKEAIPMSDARVADITVPLGYGLGAIASGQVLIAEESYRQVEMRIAAVTEPLGYGLGVIAPGQELRGEDAYRHAETLIGLLTKVDEGAPSGCIDGRVGLKMLNNAEIKAGLKSAGGNSISIFYGLEISGFFDDDSSIYKNYATAINVLENSGHTIGFHTRDVKAADLASYILEQREEFAGISVEEVVETMEAKKVKELATACAANDELEAINGKLSRNKQAYNDGKTESDADIAARLENTFGLAVNLSNDQIDRVEYERHIDRATLHDNSGRFKAWHPVKALLLADKILIARGIADGVLGRIQVLKDDGKGIHGHNESNVVGIKVHGMTLETRTVYEATSVKDFIVNGDEIGNQARDDFDHPDAKLATLLYQVGAKTHLTNGHQRGIIIGN